MTLRWYVEEVTINRSLFPYVYKTDPKLQELTTNGWVDVPTVTIKRELDMYGQVIYEDSTNDSNPT